MPRISHSSTSSLEGVFLGCWLLGARAIMVVSGFMVATLIAYTVFLGFFLPSTWLEPLWWFDQKYTAHSGSFGYGGTV